MLLVTDHDGALEVRWSWLPLWIAMNPELIAKLDRKVRECVDAGVTDTQALHGVVVDALAREFPSIANLDKMLEAVKDVDFVA